jgi:hypothetical protein
MSQNQRQFGVGQLTVHDVQIGAADATGMDADKDLLRIR